MQSVIETEDVLHLEADLNYNPSCMYSKNHPAQDLELMQSIFVCMNAKDKELQN